MCQIEYIKEMGIDDPALKIKKYSNNALKMLGIYMFIKTIRGYKTKSSLSKNENVKNYSKNLARDLKTGDKVRVRSREQIMETLNEEKKLEGCYFMDEMWQYCGSEQKVLKKVKYFYDEREAKHYKAYRTVILENLCCSGKLGNFMPKCDRNCFFFWKEDWLEKIE